MLAMKGIDYEYRAVNLIKDGGQQHSAEYKALNPMGQVPAFIIGDVSLTQSLAIIDYLEDVYPEPSITPKDPIKKAQARALAEVVGAGIQPIQSPTVQAKHSDNPAEQKEWGQFWIDKGLTALEKMLPTTCGKYCVGDNITIADICLVPQRMNAERFGVDMSKFPTITRIMDECSKLDAFKKAHPFVQPDCPEDLRIKT